MLNSNVKIFDLIFLCSLLILPEYTMAESGPIPAEILCPPANFKAFINSVIRQQFPKRTNPNTSFLTVLNPDSIELFSGLEIEYETLCQNAQSSNQVNSDLFSRCNTLCTSNMSSKTNKQDYKKTCEKACLVLNYELNIILEGADKMRSYIENSIKNDPHKCQEIKEKLCPNNVKKIKGPTGPL